MSRKRNTTEQPEIDAAAAKASEYHRSIGAALEDIADQIPDDMQITITVCQGMFEATLFSEDGGEIPVHMDFEDFADELLYLLNVAKGLRARDKALKVQTSFQQRT